MPRDEKGIDSDEEMAPPDVENQTNNDEEEDGDEEYEIEQILEARHGAFANGKIGYLVKWKGYGPEDNSWVNEDDATGAADLIAEYWDKTKKNQRKSNAARKSLSSQSKKQSPEIDGPSTQKRGRTSSARPISISDTSEDDGKRPQSKKTKTDVMSVSAKKSVAKSASVTRNVSKPKRPREPSPDSDDEEEEFGDMRTWKSAGSWEEIVERVDTVERTEDGKLYVFFTLNAKGLTKAGNVKCREESSLCKKKFPNTLLDFYERNLRWKKLDDETED